MRLKYTQNRFVLSFVILLLILLSGCNQATEPIEYTQAILPQPDKIVITCGSDLITYEINSAQYNMLITALSKNWWKTADNEENLADDSMLVDVSSLKTLKTTSDKTHIAASDIVIHFFYTSSPILWDVTAKESTAIHLIAFILPQSQGEKDENVRGFFTISQTDSLGTNDGLYTYYYAPELVNDFWAFLNK